MKLLSPCGWNSNYTKLARCELKREFFLFWSGLNSLVTKQLKAVAMCDCDAILVQRSSAFAICMLYCRRLWSMKIWKHFDHVSNTLKSSCNVKLFKWMSFYEHKQENESNNKRKSFLNKSRKIWCFLFCVWISRLHCACFQWLNYITMEHISVNNSLETICYEVIVLIIPNLINNDYYLVFIMLVFYSFFYLLNEFAYWPKATKTIDQLLFGRV